MTLQARLDRMRTAFEKQAPAEALAVMHRTTDDLRANHPADRVVAAGQPAPPFTLENSAGQPTRLADLHRSGPLVPMPLL